MKVCSIPECSAPARSRGWCYPHYKRWWRHGDPLAGVGFAPGVLLRHRLDTHIDSSGGPGACWPWIGANKAGGYGQLRWKGKNTQATHLIYELYYGHGPTDEKPLVCHHCDNPPCCNPRHLFLGSYLDNVRDSMEKGRATDPPILCGEECPNAKLTEDQVREIRQCYALGRISQPQLAHEYGVTQANISSILHRKSWKHVA